jgi:hypothetical protein
MRVVHVVTAFPRTEHDPITPWLVELIRKQRRAGIESVVRDLRAERLSFGNRAVPKQVHACNDDSQFYFPDGGCKSSGQLAFTAGGAVDVHVAGTVPGIGTPAAIRVKALVDDNNSVSDDEAVAAASDFLDAMSTVLAAFNEEDGHGPGLDRNTDGAIAVVFTPRVADVGTNIVGFFEFRDFMDAGATSGGIIATGNEADLLWAQVPSQQSSTCPATVGCPLTTMTHEVVVGTLAHEYTHLITYARRVHSAGTAAQNEVLWLDEGIAHMMEDAAGWGASNIGVVAEAFADNNWPNTLLAGPPGDAASDTPAQRGQAYLYLRHLVEQRASGAQDAAEVNITLPGELLGDTELGFLHPAIANHGADGFWSWLLATFATEHPDVTQAPAHAADYLPVADHDLTGQPVGVNPNGEYVDARNGPVPLASDDILGDGSTDELTETGLPDEFIIGVSGSMLFKVISSETGTTTLTGTGPAEVDLQMRAIRVW